MANEAVLVTRTQHPINFIISNTTGIEKGTILKMTDPMTAAASDGINDIVAGIAAIEKVASDGTTKLAVYRGGIFKMYLSGSASVGDPVGTTTPANYIASNIGTANLSGSRILGTALETGTTGETILVELDPTNQTRQV